MLKINVAKRSFSFYSISRHQNHCHKPCTNPDGSLTARGNKILSLTPMGRFGDPADLVGAVLWLLDDAAAAFVTGVVLPIDGGFNAFSGV